MWHLEGRVHLYREAPEVTAGTNVDNREANPGTKLNKVVWTLVK